MTGRPSSVTCPDCDAPLAEGDAACPSCGLPLEIVSEARPIGALAGAWEASEEEPFALREHTWEGEAAPASHARPSRTVPFLGGLAIGFLLAATAVGIVAYTRAQPAPSPATPAAAGATTTSSAPPVETTLPAPTAPAPFIPPQGDPLAVEDLTLSAVGLGPLELGDPADGILGRLTASLGQPDEDTGPVEGEGTYGECVGDQVRRVRWGPLVVIVDLEEEDPGTFAAYRLDAEYGGNGPAAQLRSLSGLQLGDGVADLERIYSGFDIDYVEIPGIGLSYELRSRDGTLLIWGPVAGTQEDGTIRGIYSRDACGI